MGAQKATKASSVKFKRLLRACNEVPTTKVPVRQTAEVLHVCWLQVSADAACQLPLVAIQSHNIPPNVQVTLIEL